MITSIEGLCGIVTFVTSLSSPSVLSPSLLVFETSVPIVDCASSDAELDISHPSKEAIRQMIELSKAPVIASHSSARALRDHPRNLDDEQLNWVKENGGVIQTTALGAFLTDRKDPPPNMDDFMDHIDLSLIHI